MVTAGFIGHYLNGSLIYVRCHITILKCVECVVKLNISFLYFFETWQMFPNRSQLINNLSKKHTLHPKWCHITFESTPCSSISKCKVIFLQSPILFAWSYCFEDSITEGRKEGNVLFNNTLNTFYLRLYGITHMVKDHSDSKREETHCHHMSYIIRLAARVLLYASSHR